MSSLNPRYERHYVLDNMGPVGQSQLQRAHVALVGLGGLGSSVGLYLTAAGIGKFTLIDGDCLEESNLQRQVLYDESLLGQAKAACAQAALQARNSRASFEAISDRVTEANASGYLQAADIIIDCTDNFSTRFVLNRYCRSAAKPLIIGACTGYIGQVATLDFRQPDCPCYACLYPETPGAPEKSPAEIGILSPLPGLIGTVEAIEAIRLIVDSPSALTGKLWTLDSRTMQTRISQLNLDEACECQKR